MIKKILIMIVIVSVLTVWYVYYSSIQQPTDIYIASNTVTQATSGDIVTQSGDSISIIDGSYIVEQNSLLGRKASKPGWAHTGIISVLSGFIVINNNMITAGNFTLEMPSIKVLDIDDSNFEMKIRDDFFEADLYPVSYFILSGSQFVDGKIIVSGELTIKDQTHPITFPIYMTHNTNTVHIQASFAIDRLVRWLTMWEGKVNNYIEYTIDMNFIASL